MIVFRQVDGRYPFLWANVSQPAGRWHAAGEGPAHYFADTPDGAWAEFLRHEEITDVDDLLTIRRQMWAVEIDDSPSERVTLPPDVLTGGPESYAQCQDAARVARATGARRLVATSAALKRGGARGLHLGGHEPEGGPRDGYTIVIFEAPTDLTAWAACVDGHPAEYLLDRVRHFHPTTQGTSAETDGAMADADKSKGKVRRRRE
jgi:hypothetical protein